MIKLGLWKWGRDIVGRDFREDNEQGCSWCVFQLAELQLGNRVKQQARYHPQQPQVSETSMLIVINWMFSECVREAT